MPRTRQPLRLPSRLACAALALASLAASAPIAAGGIQLAAYPNPFKSNGPGLRIAQVKNGVLKNFKGRAHIFVFNIHGAQVYTGEFTDKIHWTGFDEQGDRLAPGVYHIKVVLMPNSGGSQVEWLTAAIE